jgi:predicted O-methyltransferase YrrM
MSSFWDFITGVQHNTFDSLITNTDKFNLHGWCDDDSKLLQEIAKMTETNKSECIDIIEIGTWKGLSANKMAKLCKSKNKKARIVCVDTFLGAPEHMDGEWASNGLDRVNGIPCLFESFRNNTKILQNHDIIYPFPISSMEAAHFMIKKQVEVDLIFIDGSHEYESVLMDITLFWKVLKKGGVMVLDDAKWEGVDRAITEFFTADKNVDIEFGPIQTLVYKK